MQALIKELGQYVSGSSDRDQFRNACRDFLAANPNERAEAAHWFEQAVSSERVPAAIWGLVKDLFAEPVPTAAVAAAPARPAAFGAATVLSVQVEAPQTTLRVGDVLLNNRYCLVEELGVGGMGQVFKARDRNLERAGNPNPFIALKALNAMFSKDDNARSALQSEAISVMRLSHDNIIRVNNFDWDGQILFIAMEYLKGSPLDNLIQTEYASGLSVERAWPIIGSIGAALSYAHGKGVIHSDVKPSNVFITRKNVVKVLDFGISRPMAQSSAVTDTIYDPVKPIAGLSPAYASLEQWTGEPADARDDIYSFALLIYELLTGHHPFASVSAKKAFESGLVPHRIDTLSRKQWDALRHALALERDKRTKSVSDLLLELEPPTFFRKYRTWIIGGAAIAIAAAVVFGSHGYSNYVEQAMLRSRAHIVHPHHLQLTDSQKKEVASLMSLAVDGLASVNDSTSADDLTYVLSEGANSVNEILDGIIRIDPDNERVPALKASAAALYLRKAQQLADKGDDKSALPLVQFGLKMTPDGLDLFHLQQSICDRQPSLCVATPN